MSTLADPAAAPLPFVDPQQLSIDGLGPVIGGRYRHRKLRSVAIVLSIEQRRKGWVTFRVLGGEQTTLIASFLRNFEPF